MVADQLRTRRKTATIRLGDKSRKYRKGMVVQVLIGHRFGPREKVFEAVIDKVEVKSLVELSPREIEHDNPEIRRPEEIAKLPLAALQPRGRAERHGHGHPLLRDREPGLLHVPPRLARTRGGLRIVMPPWAAGRSAAPHSSHSTENIHRDPLPAGGTAAAHLAGALRALRAAAPTRPLRCSAGRGRSPRRRRPSRLASGAALPGASPLPCPRDNVALRYTRRGGDRREKQSPSAR